tara:strand:+ start:491 stop:1912 length:1422 start_codon:yes stop_codon:yes gene_type:complete
MGGRLWSWMLLTLGVTVFAAGTAAVATAVTAEASEVSCGTIQCNVSSQAYAEGTNSSNPPAGSSSGGGSGSGSGGNAPRVSYDFTACRNWYGNSAVGFQSSNSFPDPALGGNYTCRFEGQATDLLKNLPICYSLGSRVAYGRVDVYADGQLWYSYCAYPSLRFITPSVSYFTRPTGGVGEFWLATSNTNSGGMATQYGSTGTLADTTGYRGTGFNPANPAADVRLNQSFNAKTAVSNGQPLYGYYRLQWRIDWTEWRLERYPSWLGKADQFTHIRDFNTVQVTPYTYTCSSNPPLVQGVVGGVSFTAADCVPTQWQCDIAGEIQVNGTSQPTTVMRDGSDIGVTFPSFGVSGNGVSNVRNQQMFNNVDTAAVSPVNGSNPEGEKQYFWADWRWNRWTSYQPSGTLAFYWSSDNGKRWWFTQKYQFTAEFWVPTAASINGGSAFQWVTDTTECGVEKRSPDVTVVRSVNSDNPG